MKRLLRSLLLSPLIFLTALYILLEDFIEATVLPLARLLSELNLLKSLEAFLHKRHPYTLFGIYACKFAIFSCIKLFSLYLISSGKVMGAPLLVTGELSGALITVWYAKVALPSLLTLSWFAKGYEKLVFYKSWIVGKLQQMEIYHYAKKVVLFLRSLVGKVRNWAKSPGTSSYLVKKLYFVRAIYRFVRKH